MKVTKVEVSLRTLDLLRESATEGIPIRLGNSNVEPHDFRPNTEYTKLTAGIRVFEVYKKLK